MFWRRLATRLRLLIFGLLLVAVTAPEWPAFQDERYLVRTIVRQREFDFLVWEVNALLAKGEAGLVAGPDYLDEASQAAFVLDYLADLRQALAWEREVRGVFVDPDVVDPEAATAVRQAQIDALRADLAARQGLAEAIVQAQVATVLVDEGFDLLGEAWPPVQMRLTPLPSILVVSPREEIRQLFTVALNHGLPTSSHEAIENDIFADLDRSALVTPIGGVGLFPAMVVESTSITFLADVTAHEWAHHWLSLRPLGVNYAASPALRTINETVASIVGTEVGERVIARYYPAFLPPPQPQQATPPPEPADPEAPPAFEFRAEMAATRVRVDELLGAGEVEEAEAYMEARRQVFLENGYFIRRLNQAYFAFFGAYADTPGATGGDPIGPALLALREESPSLRAFMDEVAGLTRLDQLLGAQAQR